MTDGVVWVVAGDAGGANALWPVFAPLRERGMTPRLSGYAQAPGLWQGRGETVRELPPGTSVDEAETMLRESGVALLLTGTSLNGVDLERRFILAARRMGLPSLALLDYWSNYVPRFSSDGRVLDCLPERIAIMDGQAHDEMRAAEFPEALLAVTGQPLFDDLARYREAVTPESRAVTRQALGVQEGERLVLFVSQPLREVYGAEGAPGWLGYDEFDVVPPVLAALGRMVAEHPLRLVLLPHPRESRARCAAWLEGHPWASLAPAGADSRELVRAADLVVGMNSMLLMESALLGTATMSVQLGLRDADHLPVSRVGIVPRVERVETLEGTLRGLLRAGPVREEHLARLAAQPRPGGAAGRVADLARRMACGEDS